jgi:hypothetical protein
MSWPAFFCLPDMFVDLSAEVIPAGDNRRSTRLIGGRRVASPRGATENGDAYLHDFGTAFADADRDKTNAAVVA